MQKNEVELIIFKVSADGQDAIHMKIYKDGTVCRYGTGGLPQLGITGMSFMSVSPYFDSLLEHVPQEVLDNPIFYEEETPNGYIEYIMAFYGVSTNKETGEYADWSKSTGIRIKFDQQNKRPHPIIGLLDGLTMHAADLTNSWYFDVILNAVYQLKSSRLPAQTLITTPKTEGAIQQDFEKYINQIQYSSRKWDIKQFGNNKTFETPDGKTVKLLMTDQGNQFSIQFEEVGKLQPAEKKKWKFW
jgi:hypothetical protein